MCTRGLTAAARRGERGRREAKREVKELGGKGAGRVGCGEGKDCWEVVWCESEQWVRTRSITIDSIRTDSGTNKSDYDKFWAQTSPAICHIREGRLIMKRAMLYAGVMVAVVLVGGMRAWGDWRVGDPFKMHYPQLPDPAGLDVNFTWPKVLADDWLCIETGPVSDIHLWLSIQGLQQPPIPVPAIQSIQVWIFSDQPADPPRYSQPKDLLWAAEFPGAAAPRGRVTIVGPELGEQGWYDPNLQELIPFDHVAYWQVNITDIADPFVQQAGTIYWLAVSVTMSPNWIEMGLGKAGWKTSLQHFQDDAVWSDGPQGPWHELIDPRTGQSIDLAFVITPEPATVGLLGVGGLLMLVGRRR